MKIFLSALFSASVLMIMTVPSSSAIPAKETYSAKKQKPVVAVSIIPQKAFADAVCGGKAEVIAMIPPGFSPGNYEPKPGEMENFNRAGIFFTVGVPTEKNNILSKAKNLAQLKVIRCNEEIAKKYPDRETAPGKRDAHIWLSPKRAKMMTEIIAREMGLLDPANRSFYEKNAKKYIAELDALDKKIKQTLANVKTKKFIVFHPAYGYFADDYGLEMYALEKDGKEATADRLKEMTDLAKKDNIKAIFYQAEISSRQAQAFAEEIGGKTVQLEPLAYKYLENLKRMAELMAQVMR